MNPRLAALFLVAAGGVAAAAGVLVAHLGPLPLGLYLLALGSVIAGFVHQARAQVRARGATRTATPARPPGRTCTCCTSTVHDPVQVI